MRLDDAGAVLEIEKPAGRPAFLGDDRVLQTANGEATPMESIYRNVLAVASPISAISYDYMVSLCDKYSIICSEKTGMAMIIQGAKGEYSLSISQLPIKPIAILEPYDSDEVYIKLIARSLTAGDLEFTIPFGALASPKSYPGEIKLIQKHGFPMLQAIGKTGKTLSLLLHEQVVEMQRQGALAHIIGAMRPGWHWPDMSVAKSVSKPLHIMPGADGYIGDLPAIVERRGDRTEWLKTIRQIIDESPGIGVVAAIAAGSYLRGWIPVETKIYHFHGDTSLGKTAAIKVAASMIGAIKSSYIISSWNASSVGYEKIAQAAMHGFIGLDESHAMLETCRDPLGLLMHMCNDEGLLRGTKNGGLREKNQWNISILSNGNSTLTHVGEGTAQGGALRARVLEVDAERFPLWSFNDSRKASEYEDALNRHHGHGYEMLIKCITDNPRKYIGIYDDAEKRISAEAATLGQPGNALARRAKGWCLARAGLELIADAFDLSEDAVSIARETIDDLERLDFDDAASDSGETAEGVRDEVRAYVMRNLRNFSVKGYWFTGGTDDQAQRFKAQELTTEANKAGIIGVIEQEAQMLENGAITGRVYIASKANDKTRDTADLASLAAKADRFGLLIKQAGQAGKRIFKKRPIGNCYAFDLSEPAEK